MTIRLLQLPELCSTEELLTTPNGVAYYIPAYQRHFSWANEDIGRFFSDIANGIRSIPGDGREEGDLEAETFMGTVVCLEEGTPPATVYPQIKDDLPDPIYILIDGQQRLTVSLITAIALHEFLQVSSTELLDQSWCENVEHGVSQDKRLNLAGSNKRFIDQFNRTKKKLSSLLSCDDPTGDLKYFPKLIRGPDDIWSTTRELCRYRSPIGCHIQQYIDYLEGYNPVEMLQNNDKVQLIFSDIVRSISTAVSSITSEYASINQASPLLHRESIQRALFGRSGSFDVLRVLAEYNRHYSSDKDDELLIEIRKTESLYNDLAKVISFSTYFLHRVKYVRMRTASIKYAFNIFDSLNSTGDPLTAFEILVPEIIRQFKSVEEYDKSAHKMMVNEIDKYLQLTKDKQMKKTRDLIISFALAESGKPLSSDLGEQRKYLLAQYKRVRNEEGENGLAFIRQLLHVARVNEVFENSYTRKSLIFLLHVMGYSPPPPEVPEAGAKFNQRLEISSEDTHRHYNENEELAAEAVSCLHFLALANHKIVIPLLSRFYSELLRTNGSVSHRDMCNDICSTASFFALWRSTVTTTRDIDNRHREIMYNPDSTLPDLNFARSVENNKLPNIELLKGEYYRLLAKHGLRDKSTASDAKKSKLSKCEWVKSATGIPIYATQREVAKLILLLYGNTSMTDPESENSEAEEVPSHGQDALYGKLLPVYPKDLVVAQMFPEEPESEYNEARNWIGNLFLIPKRLLSAWKKAEGTSNNLNKRRSFIKRFIDRSVSDEELVEFLLQIGISNTAVKQLVKEREKIISIIENEEIMMKYLNDAAFATEIIRTRSKEILNATWDPLIRLLGPEPK